jgi:hypothetical protein
MLTASTVEATTKNWDTYNDLLVQLIGDATSVYAEATAGNRVIKLETDSGLWQHLLPKVLERENGQTISGTREAYHEFITSHIQPFTPTSGVALKVVPSSISGTQNYFVPAVHYLRETSDKYQNLGVGCPEQLRPMISSGGKSAQLALPLFSRKDIFEWVTMISRKDHTIMCGTENRFSRFFSIMRIDGPDRGTPIALPQPVPATIDQFPFNGFPCTPIDDEDGDGEFKGCIMAISFLAGGQECSGFNLGGVDATMAVAYESKKKEWVEGGQCRAGDSATDTSCSSFCVNSLVRIMSEDNRWNLLEYGVNENRGPTGNFLKDYIRRHQRKNWIVAGSIDEYWSRGTPLAACRNVKKDVKFTFLFFAAFFRLLGLAEAVGQKQLAPRYAAAPTLLQRNSWVTGKAAELGYLHPCGMDKDPVLGCKRSMTPMTSLEELDHSLNDLFE